MISIDLDQAQVRNGLEKLAFDSVTAETEARHAYICIQLTCVTFRPIT